MDYDFRITVLEKELAHAREMQALTRSRVDAHDTGFAHVKDALSGTSERLDRIESLLEQVAGNLNILTGDVKMLAGNVDALVAALLRQHPNGH